VLSLRLLAGVSLDFRFLSPQFLAGDEKADGEDSRGEGEGGGGGEVEVDTETDIIT